MMTHYHSRNLSWAMLALVVLVLVPNTVAAAPAAKRNVVFFLVDDMRYDAMSCMGHPFLETPAIDALAAGGVHFRNAFVTTSLCSPSRATFLSGLYAHQHKILDNSTLMDPAIPTFPRLLHEAEEEKGMSPIMGLHYCLPVLRGRPRGRKVDCKPSRVAACFSQIGEPNGRPR